MKIETSQFKDSDSAANAINMDAYWMPYTPNRYFKSKPKIMVAAKGIYYTDDHGRQLFDGASGLWTSPLGHGDPRIIEAIQKQYQKMDYVPAFQMAGPETFRLAERITQYAPAGLNKVFFVNSGSEAVDTALKMAIAYHRAKGEASRVRFIGRERAYHGGCIGGISVGGIPTNRKSFGAMMVPGVDHLPHTLNLSQMAFSKGMPTWGAHLADELERIVALHDASNIAAVILEPVQGSTGVIVPPVGYLQKIREICDKHGILLIFDEVITGFGRMGTNFGADYYGVVPDMLNFAKCVTNGVIPLGGVVCRDFIYDAMMNAGAPEYVIEFFHGYTYSGHPVSCAAAIATMKLLKEENLFARAGQMGPVLGDAMHSAFKGLPNVIGIRSLGLAGAVELSSIAGSPGKRAYDIFIDCYNKGVLVRAAGENLVLCPPYIVEKEHIDKMVNVLADSIRKHA